MIFWISVYILIAAVILGGVSIFFGTKFPKISLYLKIFWGIAIVAVGYFLVVRLYLPIQFEDERKERENAAIERLKDIRKVQKAYKTIFDEREEAYLLENPPISDSARLADDTIPNYAANWAQLVEFVKTDSFTIAVYDSIPGVYWPRDTFPIMAEAAKLDYLKETITKKSVMDSIFGKDYPIDKIMLVPFTRNDTFNLQADVVPTGSGVPADVFQADVEYRRLFNGMNDQMVTNYIISRKRITGSERLMVGDIKKPNNNAGNWEK